MPTTNEPKLQPPMEAAQLQHEPSEPGVKAVVTKQPSSEPRPTMESEPELGLRGGGFYHHVTCGYSTSLCGGCCRIQAGN